MRYARIAGLITVIMLAVGLVGGWNIRRRSSAIPASLTGPNLLPNTDFMTDADGDKLPDGWTTAGVGGVEISEFTFTKGQGRSVQISGINNHLASPFIAVRPGASYRVAFRVLDDNPDKPSTTQVRVRFNWRDAEGLEFLRVNGEWQAVRHGTWSTISDTGQAPEGAKHLSISVHPASDDPIILHDFQLGQIGVRINPWPDGKRAALAFSFDYETAMGGLIHSTSVRNPATDTDPIDRAQRMRVGADEILRLFTPAGIRGTWYVNGYNFLNGNREAREFMGNPTYTWATTENGWPTDYWASHPWFAPDPHTDEHADPEWYFGSQLALLQAAGQDIQSHTFAHFDGGLAQPDDWRDDFEAWNAVAAPMGVPKPSSLAFPWSSTAGMRWDNWEVLVAHGVRSITRTNWKQAQYRLADRDTYALRRLPGHETIAVIADEYLTTESLPRVRQKLEVTRLNEGAIDIWAHTEEVTSAEQRDTWMEVIAAREQFWVAPVPEIVDWSSAVEHVSIRLQAEEPRYTFHVVNDSRTTLRGLTLVLPFVPDRVTVDDQPAKADGDRLSLDIPGRSTIEVTLWRA